MGRHIVILIFLIFISVHWARSMGYAQEETGPAVDIVIVLDNSVGMKASDPEFLTKKVVSSFLNSLPGNARFNIFLDMSDLIKPMVTMSDREAAERIAKALNKINYQEKRANLPASIEWAIYGLKRDGRADAGKMIIFILGGSAGAEGSVRSIEISKEITEKLASESKKAGIKIFGIALTDRADFEFVQALGQGANGGYYRASGVEELQEKFNIILSEIRIKAKIPKANAPADALQQIKTPQPAKPEAPIAKEKSRRSSVPMKHILIALVGGLAIGVAAFALILKIRKGKGGGEKMIHASLMDLKADAPATDKKIHNITKRVITIGREKAEGVDIIIPKSTISATHAQIEYRNRNFYLTDLRSRNGTYLNEGKDKITGEVCLKDGDIIAFDQYKFKFIIPSQSRRRAAATRKDQHDQTILRMP